VKLAWIFLAVLKRTRSTSVTLYEFRMTASRDSHSTHTLAAITRAGRRARGALSESKVGGSSAA